MASPVHATGGHDVTDCGTYKFKVEPGHNANHRAWRAVIDDLVVWQSGDFGDDLGDDHQTLVDNGWTMDGPFWVEVDGDDAAKGPVSMQWWHVNPPGNPNGWTDWGGEDGPKFDDYPRKCNDLKEPEVTQPTCEDPKGYITIPDKEGVKYKIDGEDAAPGVYPVDPGTYEVTAKKRVFKDYKWHTFKRTWIIDIIEPRGCETPPPDNGGGGELPKTGTQVLLVAGIAMALLALGGGLYFATRRRRISFTA
jgi:LPXTG-motif cell wall-anchored protein